MKIMPLIIIKIFAVMEIIFFFAMVMAEILFLIFGVILISAFYLIEKLIQKNFISEGEKTMKKIFLTTMALLTMASANVFGMYGPDSDWITFLTDGNRFRARADQLGFTLGNDMIKGTFGFDSPSSTLGHIYSTDGMTNWYPNISAGIGYTSSVISVGVGYNATIGNRWRGVDGKNHRQAAHTPVLVLNALDNAFRMAIPIQVVNLTEKFDGIGKGSVTAVSFDAQFRYYTGLEMLPQVRLYLKYGNYSYNYKAGDVSEKGKYAESFGFDLRFYFGSMVEEVALQPIVKLAYNGALGKQHNKTAVTALNALDDAATTIGSAVSSAISGSFPTSTTYGGSAVWKQGAWDLTLAPSLGLTANSDIVSLYLEPSLGLKITQSGDATDKVKEVYALTYGAYAEIYITPLKNLEWYFEADVSGDSVSPTQGVKTPVKFASSTGITWYLPQL